MAFTAIEKGPVLVIQCPDQIDELMGKQLTIQQDKWLSYKTETIALNFSNVDDVDDLGFRALTVFAKKSKEAKKKFVLVNPKPAILKLIKRKGLEEILNSVSK